MAFVMLAIWITRKEQSDDFSWVGTDQMWGRRERGEQREFGGRVRKEWNQCYVHSRHGQGSPSSCASGSSLYCRLSDCHGSLQLEIASPATRVILQTGDKARGWSQWSPSRKQVRSCAPTYCQPASLCDCRCFPLHALNWGNSDLKQGKRTRLTSRPRNLQNWSEAWKRVK